jgi:glycerophosphoryl diester phosphodiesterase
MATEASGAQPTADNRLLGVTVNCELSTLSLMHRTPLSPPPLVYAHRGDRSRAEDNTLEAYRLAVEAGADGIEMDVRRTVDGVLVMNHDDRRPGFPPIVEMTFAEIREQLPSMPTLIETLASVPQDVWLNVEVKNFPDEADFDGARNTVIHAIETIDAHDTLDRILLSSFDPVTMQRAAQASPETLRAQLVRLPYGIDVGIAAALSQGAHAVNPEVAHFSENPLVAISSIHDAGLEAIVWRVETPEDIAKLFKIGVDGVITDDPAMARRVIDQL